jgi:exonuclease VII small subunit
VLEEIVMSLEIGQVELYEKNNNSYERAKLKYQ